MTWQASAPGRFGVQWAQNTADTKKTRLCAGSYITLKQLDR
jgi:hypothetical protein